MQAGRLAFLRMSAFLLVGLVALGSAVLFRSYWAILVVPLAICLGAFLVSSQIATFYPTITDENSTYTVFGAAAMTTWIVLPFMPYSVLSSAALSVCYGRGGGRYEE